MLNFYRSTGYGIDPFIVVELSLKTKVANYPQLE